jgi:hypothetical protein
MVKRKQRPPVRKIIPMTVDLIGRINDEWHARKLPSWAATVRVLLEEALAK